MTRNKQLIVGIGILISVVFLYFAFRNLNPEAVIDHIGEANVGWLALAAVWYFAGVTVIALRWQYLLRAIQFVSLRVLVPLVAIGYMGNNVYPFRSGEVLRIVLLRRSERIPITKATTTVIVERTFDGLVMLTFILVALLLTDVSSDRIRTVALISAPIFLTALAVFLVLAARPNLLRRIVQRVSLLLPGKPRDVALRLSEDVIHGLEGLRSPADLAGAVVSSFVSWMIEASVYWLVSFAFDLGLSYPVMLLVVGTVNLAGLIPASPGQIGVYESVVGAVLVAAGVVKDRAVAYALVVHVVIWLPVTLVGFYFLARRGLGWSAITHARELEQQSAVS